MSSSALHISKSNAEKISTGIISVEGLNVWSKNHHILKDVSIEIPKNKITCIIGPSGSGKSTLLRTINRINDVSSDLTHAGSIRFQGINVLDDSTDITRLRSNVGMVFQKPCVFPKSIQANVLFGRQASKKMPQDEELLLTEKLLTQVGLWKETAHRLDDTAYSLSLGQQQRLCIARSLAVEPKVLLMDEPTSSLDPISSKAIEMLCASLKDDLSIVFVTHNIAQAKRIADHLIFLCDGEIIESGSVKQLLTAPKRIETLNYLNNQVCDC